MSRRTMDFHSTKGYSLVVKQQHSNKEREEKVVIYRGLDDFYIWIFLERINLRISVLFRSDPE